MQLSIILWSPTFCLSRLNRNPTGYPLSHLLLQYPPVISLFDFSLSHHPLPPPPSYIQGAIPNHAAQTMIFLYTLSLTLSPSLFLLTILLSNSPSSSLHFAAGRNTDTICFLFSTCSRKADSPHKHARSE